MSGDVSIDIILAVERAFDGGDMRRVAHPRLWQQSQKRLPSVSTYAARGGGARKNSPIPSNSTAARVFERCRARAQRFRTHTSQSPDSFWCRAGARGRQKRSGPDAIAARKRLLTAIPKNNFEFSKQPVTNARRAPSGYKSPRTRGEPGQPLTQPTARRHPFGQVEKY